MFSLYLVKIQIHSLTRINKKKSRYFYFFTTIKAFKSAKNKVAGCALLLFYWIYYTFYKIQKISSPES